MKQLNKFIITFGILLICFASLSQTCKILINFIILITDNNNFKLYSKVKQVGKNKNKPKPTNKYIDKLLTAQELNKLLSKSDFNKRFRLLESNLNKSFEDEFKKYYQIIKP